MRIFADERRCAHLLHPETVFATTVVVLANTDLTVAFFAIEMPRGFVVCFDHQHDIAKGKNRFDLSQQFRADATSLLVRIDADIDNPRLSAISIADRAANDMVPIPGNHKPDRWKRPEKKKGAAAIGEFGSKRAPLQPSHLAEIMYPDGRHTHRRSATTSGDGLAAEEAGRNDDFSIRNTTGKSGTLLLIVHQRESATMHLVSDVRRQGSKRMTAMTSSIERISVVGAGIMGHGIAQEFAAAGFDVTLTDTFPAALDTARERIVANLSGTDGAESTLARIRFEPDLASAVELADLVVEAVPERLELKQQLFADLDGFTPAHTILASNTSSFMPSQLAPKTSRPDKVLVTHYFNPPHLVPLVEVVRGPETSAKTTESVRALYEQIGKIPVVVQKERLGFIGNRLQNALFREALALVDEGVCSIEDLDTVMHTSIGRRWSVAGIFEVFDLAGLDTVFAVSEQIFPDLSNASTPPAAWLERVQSGDHGIKSGSGFYEWTPESGEAARRRIRLALQSTGNDIETKQG